MSDPLQATIGRYQVVGRLSPAQEAGAGGAGVFLARKGEDLFVVHRVPAPASDPAAELLRFEGLSKSHRALPKLVEVVREENSLALVFPQLEGVALGRLWAHLARDKELLAESAIWLIGHELCGALARCHELRGPTGRPTPLVHGRLSTYTLLVTWNGEVRVLGLCPLLGSEYPVEVAEREPSPWLAPELRRGWPPSPRSDVYGAALIVRSLLLGNPAPPAQGAPIEPLAALRPDLPAGITRALDRAIEPSARDRAVTAAELERQFHAVVEDTGGVDALREAMEMFQALWSLWSVPARRIAKAAERSLVDEQESENERTVQIQLGEVIVPPPAPRAQSPSTEAGAPQIPRPQPRAPSTPPARSQPPADALDGESTMVMAVPKLPPRAAPEQEPKTVALDRSPDLAQARSEPPAPSTPPAPEAQLEAEPAFDTVALDASPVADLPPPRSTPPAAENEPEFATLALDRSPLADLLKQPRSTPPPASERTALLVDPRPLPAPSSQTNQAAVPTNHGTVPTSQVTVPTSQVTVPTNQWTVPTNRLTVPTNLGTVPTIPALAPTRGAPWLLLVALGALCAGAASLAFVLRDRWLPLLSHSPTATATATSTPTATAATTTTATPTSTATPTAIPTPIATSTSPATATATPTATPAPTASAIASAALSASAEPPGLPSGLLNYEAYLTVKSSADATVYVKGVAIGRTNHKNRTYCRWQNIRLGVEPGPSWLSKPVVEHLPCMASYEVAIEPDPALVAAARARQH